MANYLQFCNQWTKGSNKFVSTMLPSNGCLISARISPWLLVTHHSGRNDCQLVGGINCPGGDRLDGGDGRQVEYANINDHDKKNTYHDYPTL
jgi:hypothetical protein